MKKKQTFLTFSVCALLTTTSLLSNQYAGSLVAPLFIKTKADLAQEEKQQQDQHELQAYAKVTQRPFPSAKTTYRKLNQDSQDPFACSVGAALSQTHVTNNTMHPDNLKHSLLVGARKAAEHKGWISHNPEDLAYQWLKERQWYAMRALNPIHCNECDKTTDPSKIRKDNELFIDLILEDLASNYHARELNIRKCPHCASHKVQQLPKINSEFSDEHRAAMSAQVKHLGALEQVGVQSGQRPTYRLSLEMADSLDEYGHLDESKIVAEATWLQDFGNPMLFMHHYAKVFAHQFERSANIAEFANYCALVVKHNPHVTHVCPISQPIAFVNRTARQKDLPPFDCTISKSQLTDNVATAQLQACKAMKAVNPHIKTMVSHQFKDFRPYHSSTHPLYYLEKGICKIADMLYNQGFINTFKKQEKYFDALALSLYPTLYFNKITPMADCNCSGQIDPQAALKSIIEMHKAFPTKEIYIVETGCNTPDPKTKKEFIDMTLHVCSIARELGIPVKGCYFWTQTNDPEYYLEWNSDPGSTHFGFFDRLDPQNPNGSINESGRYLKEILEA